MKRIIILLTIVSVATGCSIIGEKETLTMDVSPSTLNFSGTGGSESLSITSNVISWTVESDASWLSFSPAIGEKNRTVTVKADANSSTSERRATITVSGMGITGTKTINAVLAGGRSSLSATPTLLTFDAAASSKSVSITSNGNWTVSNQNSWFSVQPSSGSGNRTLTVAVNQNNSSTARNGYFRVTAGNTYEEIRVQQSGSTTGTITVWTAKDHGCGNITVTITGLGSKTITNYHQYGTPDCGATGTASFTNLAYGTYYLSAKCGNYTWTQTVNLQSSCLTFRLL